MAFYAYLDESGKFHDGAGFINLCALLSDDAGWDTFNKRWNFLLRKHGFTLIHMTEFYSECRAREWSLAHADAVLTEFIDTIRDNILACFSIGIDAPYFRQKFQTIGKSNIDPALFAVERIVNKISDYFKQWGIPARLSLMFDEDEQYSLSCYRIISRLRKKHREIKEFVRSICFGDDDTYSPLQAVDILANLTSRFWRERIEKSDVKQPDLLMRLTSATEVGRTIMWQPEDWNAANIERDWKTLRRIRSL